MRHSEERNHGQGIRKENIVRDGHSQPGRFALLAQAQDKALKKISWGVTSISASQWIPWIAKEAGIYEKNGLDVELILLKGSGQTSTAILGGSIYAAPVALPTVMLADLSGADLVNVAHTVPGVQSKLVVRQEIKRAEDLKGKRVATSSLGSLGRFSLPLHHAQAWSGPEPRGDVAFHRDSAGKASGASIGRRGCRRSLLSDRRQGGTNGISRFFGMRGKKSSIRRCLWLRGESMSRRIGTPSCG